MAEEGFGFGDGGLDRRRRRGPRCGRPGAGL